LLLSDLPEDGPNTILDCAAGNHRRLNGEHETGEFKGVVICDPKVYASPCVAVSLSGADDLLVAQTP
jgi:hypothetical protein